MLAGAATEQIALDLSQVTFMDCSGLRTLAAVNRHVSAGGGSIRVASVPPEIARLFELVGPHGALPHIQATPLLRGTRHEADPQDDDLPWTARSPGSCTERGPSAGVLKGDAAGSCGGSGRG